MRITKEAIWDVVLEAVKALQAGSDKIVLFEDAKELFFENFQYYYDTTTARFMAKDLKEHSLDRHKVASIIICSILKTKVVGVSQKYVEDFKDKEFLGNEKIAFEVALSYMYGELEKCFQEGTIPYKEIFDAYVFPQPYSCNRQYGEVICRDLYLSNQYYDLNPLLLANLLFYIEEYSFYNHGIKRIELV